ncbi:Response regulator receiver domain-containing protein [Asanoa hainanensis]|uniref:Response regulator receiver domain-containing protein n=1 Tax=Asanoa hainanensis TaxID=560556 RepID=A0A239N0Z7_9ACTN|nr:response regulator [Asanoa hainanensis]SNT47858.1 Response regulator receiver domain-containing protein [Asanoa hainanensis]
MTRDALQILIVEDDDGDAMMIREALEAVPGPVTLHRVADGEAALAFLHGNSDATDDRPDIILLDLNMPRMDGRQTLVQLKSDPALQSIPVIILTTSDDIRDISTMYEEHASAFVTKPLDFDALESVVQQIRQFYEHVAVLPPH